MKTNLAKSRPEGAGAGPESSGPDSQGFLQARGIVMRFQGLVAINGVDFDMEAGEIVGLIGPNGAGKTTLVNVLTGFQEPTEGSVHLGSEDVTKASPQVRTRLGVARTFQGARLFPDMTVLENVEVSGVGQGLRRRAARERAESALATLRLQSFATRMASDLSTGQERRLQVARAIAMKPRFLFLDEPAAGLNESESDELLKVIKDLPGQIGCGVLLIEHDMRVIMSACSRLVVLDNGSVIKVGTPAEVRSDKAVIDAYLGS